jgi:hypothetical protein
MKFKRSLHLFLFERRRNMFTKKITYTDYNGVTRTEDFMFNLTKAELMERQMATANGLDTILRQIIDSNDQAKITEAFKQIILKSYGEKSEDGKKFIKVRNGVPLSEEFSQTEAYSELFMELSTDADKAAEFVNNIIPASLASEAAKIQASDATNNVVSTQ